MGSRPWGGLGSRLTTHHLLEPKHTAASPLRHTSRVHFGARRGQYATLAPHFRFLRPDGPNSPPTPGTPAAARVLHRQQSTWENVKKRRLAAEIHGFAGIFRRPPEMMTRNRRNSDEFSTKIQENRGIPQASELTPQASSIDPTCLPGSQNIQQQPSGTQRRPCCRESTSAHVASPLRQTARPTSGPTVFRARPETRRPEFAAAAWPPPAARVLHAQLSCWKNV